MNAVLMLPFAWLVGDFVYSRVILRRMRHWQESVTFDDKGVREGCHAYEIGSGSHALLLIHGFNDSAACYYKVAPALADRGFHCRVMRLPCFGETIESYGKCDHNEWLAAIAAEVDYLRAHHEQVSIVAHSLGGALTIRYLVEHANSAGDVDAVVLLAPAIAVNNERSPVLSAQTWHHVASRLLVFTDLVENVYAVDAHSAEAQAYPYAYRFVPQRATTEFFAVVDGVEDLAPRCQFPLLMVLTKEDLVVDWRAAERFYQAAPSRRKELHFVADAGHVLPFDNDWERIIEWIVTFLQPEADATQDFDEGRNR